MPSRELPMITNTRTETDLEQTFHALVDEWRRDTMFSSSSTARVTHPAYLRIIGLGEPVLPLLFRELEQPSGHWFSALAAITDENPVAPEDACDVEKMTRAWWGALWALGRRQGYL